MRRGHAARRGAAAFLLALLLGACATPQTDAIRARPGMLPARAEVASVPFFPQEKFYCGPAALATALAWSGLRVTQHDMVPQVYTPGRQGSLPADLVAATRRNGRLAVPVEGLGDILAEIAAGHPVVVFQNLGLDIYPVWHFAVAVGYDLDAGDLILRSARQRSRRMSLETFERTWRRGRYWAIVALPPGTLPAVAREATLLTASAGLERAGHPAAAVTAYQAVLTRWPDSHGAWIGLGNARYAAGDRRAAESAFRQATAHHPGSADAWNNLAHMLGLRGEKAQAIAAARKAVALRGGTKSAHRQTLRHLTGGPDG